MVTGALKRKAERKAFITRRLDQDYINAGPISCIPSVKTKLIILTK
jgi:hypothetical protein